LIWSKHWIQSHKQDFNHNLLWCAYYSQEKKKQGRWNYMLRQKLVIHFGFISKLSQFFQAVCFQPAAQSLVFLIFEFSQQIQQRSLQLRHRCKYLLLFPSPLQQLLPSDHLKWLLVWSKLKFSQLGTQKSSLSVSLCPNWCKSIQGLKMTALPQEQRKFLH